MTFNTPYRLIKRYIRKRKGRVKRDQAPSFLLAQQSHPSTSTAAEHFM